jgi:hypothetical protein
MGPVFKIVSCRREKRVGMAAFRAERESTPTPNADPDRGACLEGIVDEEHQPVVSRKHFDGISGALEETLIHPHEVAFHDGYLGSSPSRPIICCIWSQTRSDSQT